MLDLLKNNRNIYFKKYILDMLGNKYPKHEKLIDRMLFFLSDPDLKDFSSFLADVYESAYLKCVEDHKKSLEKVGYKVNIVAQPKEGAKSEGIQE
jgi:hypothetical protein